MTWWQMDGLADFNRKDTFLRLQDLVILLASIKGEMIKIPNELTCTEIVIVNGKRAISCC